MNHHLNNLVIIRPNSYYATAAAAATSVACCYQSYTTSFYQQQLPNFLDPFPTNQFATATTSSTFKFLPTNSTRHQQQQKFYQKPIQAQTQQPKNYVQKLYEIKALLPLEFELLSSRGPAHKPQFEMKLTINVNKLDSRKEFVSSGVSKKQAKLNASKEALKYLIQLEPNIRGKYLSENDVLEISGLILQELDETTLVATAASEPEVTETVAKKSNASSSNNNPISVFTELVPVDAYRFDIIDEWGESHAKQFKIQLIIKLAVLKSQMSFPPIDQSIDLTKPEKIFYAIGNSKKQAKSRASQIALENLFNLKIGQQEQHKQQNIVDDVNFKRFADSVGDLVMSRYVELTSTVSPADSSDSKLRTVYSAIIQTSDNAELSAENTKIICLTSGTKCINGEFMSQSGCALNDCHAEILACRLLKRYLYEQLEAYIDHVCRKYKKPKSLNDLMENYSDTDYIFEMNYDYDEAEDEHERLFRLRDNVKFHLFINTTPCGDGRIFSPHENHDGVDNHPNRKIRGLLRAKLESGEGTIPVGPDIKIQSWDGVLHGDRLKVMSCSDKLW